MSMQHISFLEHCETSEIISKFLIRYKYIKIDMYHIIHPTYVCYSFILGFTKYFFQYTLSDVFKKEHKGKENVTTYLNLMHVNKIYLEAKSSSSFNTIQMQPFEMGLEMAILA